MTLSAVHSAPYTPCWCFVTEQALRDALDILGRTDAYLTKIERTPDRTGTFRIDFDIRGIEGEVSLVVTRELHGSEVRICPVPTPDTPEARAAA